MLDWTHNVSFRPAGAKLSLGALPGDTLGDRAERPRLAHRPALAGAHSPTQSVHSPGHGVPTIVLLVLCLQPSLELAEPRQVWADCLKLQQPLARPAFCPCRFPFLSTSAESGRTPRPSAGLAGELTYRIGPVLHPPQQRPQWEPSTPSP